jgi:hypothetical protein
MLGTWEEQRKTLPKLYRFLPFFKMRWRFANEMRQKEKSLDDAWLALMTLDSSSPIAGRFQR